MLVAVVAFGAVVLNELLSVETGSPDASCPDLQQTTEAVHARLGTVKSEQPGWRARYTLGHAPGSGQGDFIHLELFDPNQRLQLVRELPVGRASCATLAQSIAIVLSGYFASLSPVEPVDQQPASTGRGGTAPPSPNEPRSAESRTPRSAPPTRASLDSSGHPPATGEHTAKRGSLHILGGGLSLPFAAYGRALTLSYANSPSEHTESGLLLALPLERRSAAAAGGRVDMWSARARFWYGRRWLFEPISLMVGPSLSVGLDSTEVHDLAEPRRKQRLVVALGLLVDSTIWIRSLGLGLQAGIDLGDRAIPRRFVVQDAPLEQEREVHSSRWINGFVGAALKLSFSN